MFDWIRNKLNHSLFSLRSCILFIFISLFLATIFTVIMMSTVSFYNSLAYTSSSLMQRVSDVVLHELRSVIRPVEVSAQASSELIASGVITQNERDLVPFTYYLSNIAILVQGAYWGDENGNFVYSHRETNGTVVTDVLFHEKKSIRSLALQRNADGKIIKKIPSRLQSFDPRTRLWYTEAKAAKKMIWTDLYPFYPISGQHYLGISVGAPAYDAQGKFLGVFGIDVRLDYLMKFINELKITKRGFSFIITADENLVAYPQSEPFTTSAVNPDAIFNVHKSGIALIDKSIDIYKKTGKYEFKVNDNNETYLVTYQPVPSLANHGWLVGVITPVDDFVSFLRRIHVITLLVSFCSLFIGILVVSGLVTRIVRPIKALEKETDRIKRFELDDEKPIQSRIKEVIHLRDSIHSMKTGLKQFQRYVPKTLVRQLIEAGQDIKPGGVRKRLVVLFTDIENFTTISEHMDPNALMMQVCEYFEAITQIILSEKGTVDKYIGDSVMAFWGAPIEEDHPSEHAARAALQCLSRLNQLNDAWEKNGKPPLHTRIGIHIGDAIVGNVGSSERLNYTALGDTINYASRLENINKIYHSHIIVSEEIYQIIKDKFVLRLIDWVMVKGRTKATYIYELLGDDVSKMTFDVPAYRAEFQKGFDAFRDQQWQTAMTHFQRCEQIYPDDYLAELFIQRCRDSLR